MSHLSVEDAVSEKNGHSLQSGEGKEEPLDDRCIDTISQHQEPQHPRHPQNGDQDKGGMEEGAGEKEGEGGGEFEGGGMEHRKMI